MSGPVSSTSTTSGAVAPDPDDPIAVVFSNESPGAVTVSFGGTGEGPDDVFAEGTVRRPPGDRPTVESGTARTGDYTLHVDVTGGPEESCGMSVEEYDVRLGSTSVVIVRDDGVRLLKAD